MIHPQSLFIHRGCTVLWNFHIPKPQCLFIYLFCNILPFNMGHVGGMQLGTREPATRQFYQGCQKLIGCKCYRNHPKPPFFLIASLDETSQAMRVACGAASQILLLCPGTLITESLGPSGSNWFQLVGGFKYPLVNCHITMERSTIFNGKTHY